MSARAPQRPWLDLVTSTTKTLGAQAALLAVLPLNVGLTLAALVRSRFVAPDRTVAAEPLTVLISGGKMTKALALARSFHGAGHRVVLVEQSKYWLTGHRFSRAVDRFRTVPKPDAPEYAEALLSIVEQEGVDVYVPVCSPVASWYDAKAAEVLSGHCEVMSCDAEMVRRLDDKFEFTLLAESLGLPVPDAHRITRPEQVMEFDFAARRSADSPARSYVLKSIPYDPVHRLDLTELPRPTERDTAEFVRGLPISDDKPWIMQEFVRGQEYCTHSTVRDGVVQLHGCCESSAFQINYAMVDKPRIEEWVRTFVGAFGLTGQVSFDFIEADDGTPYAIECNPRTHSAITMFHDHPGVAAAYLESQHQMVEPLPASRPTFWAYHEAWRLLSDPGSWRDRWRTVATGTDAIFDRRDPLPFLMVHHAQIPWLLSMNLLRGRPWERIDFNIGKLVEPGGD